MGDVQVEIHVILFLYDDDSWLEVDQVVSHRFGTERILAWADRKSDGLADNNH